MALSEGDSVGIDIDYLVSSIKDMIVPNDLLRSSKCCIFKTPSILYEHNKGAYIPHAFSIGPLHYGSPNLKATEKIKAVYVRELIRRLNSLELLSTLIKSIMEVEKDVRECYAEEIYYTPLELVKILVIDGCFIIELFHRNAYRHHGEVSDPIFTSGMLQFLYHDLILLENQVPWMILERLFYLTIGYEEKPLILLAVNFFSEILLLKSMPPPDEVIKIQGIKHLVDLFRKISIMSSSIVPRPDPRINIGCIKHFVDLFRISSIEEEKVSRQVWEFLPSATRLVESGIKFKRGEYSETTLDVKFNDGILEIPPFAIHEITETIFRNLVSYEKCQLSCSHMITSYVILLDCLINTAKDIDILCENKIIDNLLNPEDAAQLFNHLYLDTFVDYRYNDLCKEVNSFCRRKWPRWRAVLAHNYFNTPWAVISTLAAFILLVLTLLQTVYTMKN